MQRVLSKEMRSLAIFLTVVILAAALMWLVLEVATNKTVKKVNHKPQVSKNLASEKDNSEEKVPLIGENFETYQFNDPFKPLSGSQAPEENKSLSSVGSSITGSGSNTAALITNKPQVLDITLINGKEAATIKINGKIAKYVEGQKVAGYTLINISISTKTVEFLKGDQKFSIRITKSR